MESQFREGKIKEISAYRDVDVINTYQVWLRYEPFCGKLSENEFEATQWNLADYMAARLKLAGGPIMMRFFLDLFTPETWGAFQAHGSKVSGFRERQRRTAEQVKPGDLFLCYLVRLSRWCGVLEVVSEVYRDCAPIFMNPDPFVIRFAVRSVLVEVPDQEEEDDSEQSQAELTSPSEVRESHRVQAALAQIGADMGFRVWVPRSDRAVISSLMRADSNDALIDILELSRRHVENGRAD